MGDGKVVDLSSLSAFEHGKRTLTETQIVWIYKRINFDYYTVINAKSFNTEYEEILTLLLLGESKKAENLYLKCENELVYNSLAVLNFSLLKYVLASIYDKYIKIDKTCFLYKDLYDQNQRAIMFIGCSIENLNKGLFQEAIECLKEAEQITLDTKIRAWILFQYGRIYGISGNYAEATVALLSAKQKYADFIGVIRMIQTDLNLGNVYSLTNSYEKAEASYIEAYKRCMLLNDFNKLLTKCFNSLCIHYFDTNQYEKVIDLLKNKPNELVESRNTYFVLAWGYYKIGNYDEAIKYCEDGLEKFSKYSYVCMIYEYIEKACKGVKTGQDALLRKIIETEDYDNDAFTNKLFTYEIIDIYERRKNYEKAFKYAKKLLNR